MPFADCCIIAFFNDLRSHPELAKRWNGLRQDSGDPFEFIGVVVNLYNDLGIDPSTSGWHRSASRSVAHYVC